MGDDIIGVGLPCNPTQWVTLRSTVSVSLSLSVCVCVMMIPMQCWNNTKVSFDLIVFFIIMVLWCYGAACSRYPGLIIVGYAASAEVKSPITMTA
jgi:hypothetical protein